LWEKAAQALLKKFGDRRPQTLLVGQLNPGAPDQYYKNLAVNLRCRALKLFGLPVQEVEAQEPGAETLFCLARRRGLLLHAKPVRGQWLPSWRQPIHRQGHTGNDQPAGAKIAEVLHYLRFRSAALEPGQPMAGAGCWPGGMTYELLQRYYQVTAIDERHDLYTGCISIAA